MFNLFKKTEKAPEKVNVGKIDIMVYLQDGLVMKYPTTGFWAGDYVIRAKEVAEARVKRWGENNLVRMGRNYFPMHLVKKIELSDEQEFMAEEEQ